MTDVPSRGSGKAISQAVSLHFTEDTESYGQFRKVVPKLDRSRKLTRGDTLRSKLGYGWGLGLGRKDKDKDDLFTEANRTSSATTILPVYPRDAPPSFPPESTQTPTRHMSQRSKSSQDSRRSNDTQASRATKSSHGSKRSKRSQSTVNTLTGSALERKEGYEDPIREYADTYTRIVELRKHMAKDSLDY
jgi:Xaa-Pro aminopeptidase